MNVSPSIPLAPRRLRLAVLAAPVVLLLGMPLLAVDPPKPAAPAAATNKNAAIDQAIRATAHEFVTAFNRADAKAIAALFTPDATLTDERGQRFKGQAEIEAQYAALFAAVSGARLEVAIESIEVVSPQMAIEDGVASVVGGDAAIPSASRYTALHVFDGKQWRMAAVRESPLELSLGDVGVGDLEFLLGTWQAQNQGVTVELTFEWAADKAFIEGQHLVTQEGKVAFEGKQIIGYDPRGGTIALWVFNSDGSIAFGHWRPHPTGWAIALSGVTADGVETTALNSLSRVEDALVWKSTQRTAGGVPLGDTKETILKRKP